MKQNSEISTKNEVSPWEKMTLEQKKHYQDFIFNRQARYFESIKITRGKTTLKGHVPVLVPQDELEELNVSKIPDKNMLDEMVNKAVHSAFITQSGVLMNSLQNLIKRC